MESQQRGNQGLKRLREMAGLNRLTMAKACGVTSRMWQRYENEGRLPERVDVLLRIAALCEVDIATVLSEVGYEMPSKEHLLNSIKSAQA